MLSLLSISANSAIFKIYRKGNLVFSSLKTSKHKCK